MSAQFALRIVRADDAPPPDGPGQAAPRTAEPLYWDRTPRDARRLADPAFKLLAAIESFCRDGLRTCEVRDAELADECAWPVWKVKRYLPLLEEAGWIERSSLHGRRTLRLAYDLAGRPKGTTPPPQPGSACATRKSRLRYSRVAPEQLPLFKEEREERPSESAPPADGRTDGLALTLEDGEPKTVSETEIVAATGAVGDISTPVVVSVTSAHDAPPPAAPPVSDSDRAQWQRWASDPRHPCHRLGLKWLQEGPPRVLAPDPPPPTHQLSAGNPRRGTASPPRAKDPPLDESCRKVLDLKRAGAPALELATAIAHAFGKPDDQNFIARIASGVYRADKAELRDWLYAARHPSARSPAAVFIRRVEGRPPT